MLRRRYDAQRFTARTRIYILERLKKVPGTLETVDEVLVRFEGAVGAYDCAADGGEGAGDEETGGRGPGTFDGAVDTD